MKFNCGLTHQEKTAIKREKLLDEIERIKEWHRVFAWFPIRLGSKDCRWLEFVERRYPNAELWVSDLTGYFINYNLSEEHRAITSE